MQVAFEVMVANMKLKIKVGTRKPGSVPCDPVKQVEAVDIHNQCTSGNGNGKAELSSVKNCIAHLSDGGNASAVDSAKTKSSILGIKRGLEGMVEVLKGKRLKMDRSMTLKCSVILKKLMKHRLGWIFNQPVDPVALNLPDYFSIISKPMDFGTIKFKLDKNIYSVAEEFESDVKLTFSNAILYNPPSNDVHLMAKELNAFFDAQWRLVGANMIRQNTNVSQGIEMTDDEKKRFDLSTSCLKMPSVSIDTLPTSSISVKEKMKPEESVEASLEKKVPLHHVRPTTEDGKAKKRRPSKTILCVPNSNGAASCLKVESSYCCPTVGDLLPKGPAHQKEKIKPNDTKVAGATKNAPVSDSKAAVHSDSRAASCSDSGAAPRIDTRAVPRIDSRVAPHIESRSVLRSDSRAAPHSNSRAALCSNSKSAVSSLDGQVRNSSKSQMSRHDPDSDGAVSTLDEEHGCASTHVTSTSGATTTEAFEFQLPPDKALRAAMLKNRFADTILRAQHKIICDTADGSADMSKRQQEIESLERKQCEEKARIEAQIKALQLQRQREREAARIALEKMEKSVDINDNFDILRDIQMLIGDCIQTCFSHGYRQSSAAWNQFKGGRVTSPLEQLGLFIKQEYMVDDDEEAFLEADLEEGELLF
ncbi:hypothetical protein Ancab_005545 [Ancistrocladus abbreviatus]